MAIAIIAQMGTRGRVVGPEGHAAGHATGGGRVYRTLISYKHRSWAIPAILPSNSHRYDSRRSSSAVLAQHRLALRSRTRIRRNRSRRSSRPVVGRSS